MASKAVKAVRFTLAWLVVPAIFAATGYYIIGPTLGGSTPSTADDGPTDEDPPLDEPESTSKNFPPPKIEVSVKKGGTVTASDARPPRRKPKPAAPPRSEQPAPSAPSAPSTPSGEGETVPVGDGG